MSRDSNMAAVYGSIGPGALVRVHSKCEFSTILESTECDCGWQLLHAREILTAEGGVLIYLDQEGRGAGLPTKVRAYRLAHRENLDTYQTYQRLGVPLDLRKYDAAVELVQSLGLESIRLLTNNPDKIAAFTSVGIDVRRVPLIPEATPATAAYLTAKKRHGHLL
jgi:3,4-dihydroxy 2-butanone 4-phosphate synthase/GTP cyclohydrolase II